MRCILLFLVLLIYITSPAQKRGQAFADSVITLMPTAANDTIRARMYQAISNECFNTLPQKVLEYNRAGLELATKMKDYCPPSTTVIMSPDAGAMKKVLAFASKHGYDDVLCAEKVRDTKTGAIKCTKLPVFDPSLLCFLYRN